eukprot:7200105-Prymnesium_polylepis.1
MPSSDAFLSTCGRGRHPEQAAGKRESLRGQSRPQKEEAARRCAGGGLGRQSRAAGCTSPGSGSTESARIAPESSRMNCAESTQSSDQRPCVSGLPISSRYLISPHAADSARP